MEFWKVQLLANYRIKDEEPLPKLWFRTYSEAIDAAEGGSAIAGLFRHLGRTSGFFYKPKDEIIKDYPEDYQNYFQNVRLPQGDTASFMSSGFEHAVANVIRAWSEIYFGLGQSAAEAPNLVKNWNLDTGEDMDAPERVVTYWV